MTRRLTRIAPMPVGKIFGILYALFGLIFLPFFAIAGLAGFFAEGGDASAESAGVVAVGMIVVALLFPVMYGVIGFFGGLIVAGLYNLIARWIGGIEFEVEDVPPPSTGPAETPVQPR